MPGDTNGVGDIFVRDRLLGRTERVSVSSRGEQGDDILSYVAATISARGRFVAFSSYASNLVPGDTNGFADVFVRDRKNGTTERVSVSSRGAQGDGRSDGGWITGDGRFVAFYSEAANLVPGDTDGVGDIFVRDRQNGTTERVSVSSHGRQANDASYLAAANRVIALDGRFVVFESDATNLVPGDTNRRRDIFVRDRELGTTERVSVASSGVQADGESSWGVISGGNGLFVAFNSVASDLVPGDTNRRFDVFVRDR